jgi:hypothetical protein
MKILKNEIIYENYKPLVHTIGIILFLNISRGIEKGKNHCSFLLLVRFSFKVYELNSQPFKIMLLERSKENKI